MEFWGVEVKSGEPLKVSPGEGMLLHLSQASLGELKKNKPNESVYLSLEIDGKKLMLGTLFSEKMPQMQLDLVFEKEFELSHNWKHGSVFFHGYKADNPYESGDSSDEESDDSDSEEDAPPLIANGTEAKLIEEKPVTTEKANASKEKKGKQKVQIVEPPKVAEDSDSSDEDMSGDEDDSEDDDSDDTDASEEETPKKAEPSKKRPVESSSKTPVTEKKAKSTPQKTDGKKVSGHVATPYPAKGKTPANKSAQQTPKSAGQHACGSCNKSFGSDKALESHSKAKHGEGK